MNRSIPDPRVEPTISVERAAVLIGLSKASAYKAVHAGEIPSIRYGKRILVPTAALLRIRRERDDSSVRSAS